MSRRAFVDDGGKWLFVEQACVYLGGHLRS